ncbi:MAG: DNA-directed RNA polymerase subunit H [Halobacteriota archaeon]
MAGYDVLDHELVPEHEVLDEDEVEELVERYNVNKTDLPKIGRLDAAVKELDAGPGDVLRITRESWTTDRAIAYRLVVDE